MKNNSDPSAMIGRSRLKQIRKQVGVSEGGSKGFSVDTAHTIGLLEEARNWLEQFHSETVGMSCRSSGVFNSRWAELRKQIRGGQLDYLTGEEAGIRC
jgi:hypothetical protein